MGGNCSFNGISADPILLKDRTDLQVDIQLMLMALHNQIARFGPIIGFGTFENEIYAGSTNVFMDSAYSSKQLEDIGKVSFGDIDIIVPVQTLDTLIKVLQPGLNLSVFQVVGAKKFGANVSTIMYHLFTDKHYQIDFEGKQFEHTFEMSYYGSPTEFAQISTTTSFADMKLGLKGLFRNRLITAVTQATSPRVYTYSTNYGLRLVTSTKPYKYLTDIPIFISLLFERYHNGDELLLRSFEGTIELVKRHSPRMQTKIANQFVEVLNTKQNYTDIEEDVDTKSNAIDILLKGLNHATN